MAEQTDWREIELTSEEIERLRKAQERRIEQQWALAVGIGAYQGNFRPLKNAPQDAEAIARLLKSDYGFDLQPTGKLLLNGEARLAAICQAVEQTLAQATDKTRWLFYFAGHGVVVEDRGYLVPVNADKGETDSYLSLDWLRERCLDAKCAEILIVLDACYSGRALVRPEHFVDFIPDEREKERIRQLICSGSPDQPVLDGGGSGHSIFTQSLLEALQGWAGIHREGWIDFLSLLGHLALDVPARLRAQGKNPAWQQPVGGNLIGSRWHFTLKATVPRLSPEIVRGAHSQDPAQRQHNTSLLVREGQDYPERQPQAVQLAQYHLRAPGEHPGPLVAGMLRYEPVAAVRVQAATTLGELADRAATPALLAALDDVPEVGTAAARALAALADPDTVSPLLARLPTADDDLFLDLIDAIGAVGEAAAMIEALRESIRRELLVPFVGPDFAKDLTGLPNRAGLAYELAQARGIPVSSLAEVADKTIWGEKRQTWTCPQCGTVREQSGNRHDFTDFLLQELGQHVEPGSIYQALATWSIPFWISGTYDRLLSDILNAREVFTGAETHSLYERAGQPTVVRLVGGTRRVDSLRVLKVDYEEHLRHDRLLLGYLLEKLRGKVVLFVGYDPASPDFSLLVRHVLNGPLEGVNVRAFLVWPKSGPNHIWGGHLLRPIHQDAIGFVQQLSTG